MGDLNQRQFGDQLALFPDRKKGPTRRLEHAEMRPDQFSSLPGAKFHGTYHHEMPTIEGGGWDPINSAGVHLGSRAAAEERLTSLGPRNESMRKRDHGFKGNYKPVDPEAPGQIHVRRLSPLGEKNVLGSEKRPRRDRGSSWLASPDVERSEIYRNKFEDKGGVSLRVAQDEDLTSHGEAVAKAVSSGGRVHPLNRAMYAKEGPEFFDKPEEFAVTKRMQQEYLRKNPGYASGGGGF